MGRLDTLWRLFATGVSFAVFGIGGIVLTITVFPVINLLVRDRRRRTELAQRTVHQVFRTLQGLDGRHGRSRF